MHIVNVVSQYFVRIMTKTKKDNLYGINSVIGLIAAFGVIYYLAQMDLVGAGVAFIIMRITYSIAKTDEDFIEYWY